MKKWKDVKHNYLKTKHVLKSLPRNQEQVLLWKPLVV